MRLLPTLAFSVGMLALKGCITENERGTDNDPDMRGLSDQNVADAAPISDASPEGDMSDLREPGTPNLSGIGCDLANGNNFETLQAAIDNTPDGGIVRLCRDTEENIQVRDRRLIIEGEDQSEDGSGEWPMIRSANGQHTIFSQGSHLSLKNLVIGGASETAGLFYRTGAYLLVDNCEIRENRYGVHLLDAEDVDIVNTLIERNGTPAIYSATNDFVEDARLNIVDSIISGQFYRIGQFSGPVQCAGTGGLLLVGSSEVNVIDTTINENVAIEAGAFSLCPYRPDSSDGPEVTLAGVTMRGNVSHATEPSEYVGSTVSIADEDGNSYRFSARDSFIQDHNPERIHWRRLTEEGIVGGFQELAPLGDSFECTPDGCERQ
jgi:hypothetical protein